MPQFTADLDGESDFIGTLYAWQAEKERQVADHIETFVGRIAETARDKAPKGATLRLSESIVPDIRELLTNLVADVVAGAFYAGFIERGTEQSAARPFLFPAFEAHARAYYDGLRTILSS